MSSASRAVNRLRKQYRSVLAHARQTYRRLGSSACGVPVPTLLCQLEQFEPRLLLDTAGPQIVTHWPDGLISTSADHVDVTFSEAINPATFTAEDVTVALTTPVEVGFYDTPGTARSVQVVGTLAYVADGSSGLRIIDVSNPAAPVERGYYNMPGEAMSVQVVGTLAYVANHYYGLRIIDISNPAAPIQVGYYDTPGAAFSVQVVGTLAYVADLSSGLRIIDVSNLAVPVQVGYADTPGDATDVQVVGTLAYVALHYSGLRIIDVSNPAAPVQRGYYNTPGTTWDVQVVGTLAYLADASSGLQIIDVSNPDAPVERGYYDTPGEPHGVQVVGTLAYVADERSFSLRIIDVSNPAAPTEMGFYKTPSDVYGVQVVGTLAYVVYHHGLRIIKVVQPVQEVLQVDATTCRVQFAAPVVDGVHRVFIGPGITDLAGNTMDQDADGIGGELPDDQYAFNFTVDTTPPAAPGNLAFTDDTGSPGDGVTTDTEIVFTWAVATDLNGIAGYEYRLDGGDWTATIATTVTLTLAEGSHSLEVRAVDNAGYAGQAASVQVAVDLTPPSAPSGLDLDKAVLSWTSGMDAKGIWKHQYSIDGGDWTDTVGTSVATGLADGTTHDLAVRAVDRAGNVGAEASATLTVDVFGPRVVSHWPDGLIGESVDYVEVTFNEPIDAATFTAEDVSVALGTPVEVGYYDTAGTARSVQVVGTLAYVADGSSGLRILDVSAPAAPIQAGLYNTPGDAYGVQVVGTLAYVADSVSGLRIVDVSNPYAPVERGFYDTPGHAFGVQVVGTLAYVADESSGLRIIDVSNPAAPVQRGYYDTPGTAWDVQVVGTLAYVADDVYGLRIIDVSNPAAPVQRGYYDTPGSAGGVQVVGTLAYVADWTSGLRIIDVSNPAVPVQRGYYDTPGSARRVQVVGTLAYVGDDSFGLRIIDVSNPAAPAEVGYYDTPGAAWRVQVVGTLAYVADSGSGLRILKVGEPAQEVSQVDATTYRVQFAVPLADGSYHVFVGPNIADLAGNTMDQDADGTGGEMSDDVYSFSFTVDTTPPVAPGNLTLADDTGATGDWVTTDMELVFTWAAVTDLNGIAGYEYRLDGVDWTTTIVRTVTLTLAEGSHSFEVRAVDNAGNAGLAASKQVAVDLTAPEAPTGLRLDGAVLRWDESADANGIWKYQYRIDGGAWVESLTRQGITGLAEDASAAFDVRAIDKAGNVGPWASAMLTADYGPQIVAHWPDGLIGESVDYVEVTFNEPIDPATFTAEDVSVMLTTPVQVGYFPTDPGNAYDVQVVGTLAYVADWDYGLRIIDVSNPAAPIQVGYYVILGNPTVVQVVGTLAYVSDFSGLRIIDVSNPAAPVQRGYCYTPGSAYGVQIVGTLAYVADGSYGLRIIDVSNPAAPVQRGYYDTPGSAYGVQVVGSLAYVADGSTGLRILDVSNPAAPVQVGDYDTPGSALGVQVIGTLAYVADDSYGLRIIDVSNPAATVERGFYDTPGSAMSVQIFGALAYVAGSSSGLRIDVSNPAAPVQRGYYYTNSARGVQVVGTLAYVAADMILWIIEVGPSAQGVSQIDATTYRVQLCSPMAYSGSYQVFVGPGIADLAGNTMDQDADGIGGETPDDQYAFNFTVDTTPPGAPGNLAFAVDTGSPGDGVTADTELVFTWAAATDLNGIAGYEYRLDGGDWTATTNRTVTLTLVEGSHSLEVRAVDNVGNAGSATSVQVVVDLTPPSAPSGLDLDGAVLSWLAGMDANGIWKHQYAIDGGAWADLAGTSVATGLVDGTTHDLAVRAIDRAGNVGPETSATFIVDYGPRIVSHWPDGLTNADYVEVTFNEPIDAGTFTVEDVSVVMTTLVQVGCYDTPGYAWGIQVVGTLAYVADYDSGLRIIDVSNPAAPVHVGYYNTPGYAQGVRVVGTLAYVADGYSGLRIIDVSNPAAPVQRGYYDTPGSAWGVQVIGTLAYVADGSSGLRIIDVSNPAVPVQRGYYDTLGYAYGVQVVGTLAYVADYDSGLRIIDVSNPAAPVQVGYYDTPGSAQGVQVIGTLAYVADGYSGLGIVNVSTPAAPVLAGYYDTPGYARGVQIVGTLAYVADSGSGLRIIDVSNPAAPVQRGYSDAPGSALGVQVVGTLAYLADYRSGLRIIDVSNPAAPVQDVSQVGATTYRIQLAGFMADRSYQVFVGPNIADLAGNTMDQDSDGIGGETPDDVYSFSFTVDTTPPEAPGNLKFADDTGLAGDGLTADAELVFTWAAATDLNGIAGYEYRLDGVDWTATTGRTVTLTLVEGSHSLDVRAVDNVGNAGPATSVQATVDLTAPQTTSVIVNGGMAQRTKITLLAASFNEAVVCAAGALTLTNVTTSEQFNLSGVPFNPATHTWDLSGVELTNGYYTARLSAGAVEDLAGNPMSADYTFTFHRLAGDTTGDGCVDVMDYITLKCRFGRVGGAAWDSGDLDGDGDVDWSDLQTMMGSFGTRGAAPAAAPAKDIPTPADPVQAEVTAPTESPMVPAPPAKADVVVEPELLPTPVADAVAEPELLTAPVADTPPADILAIAASVLGNRLAAGGQNVPVMVAWPENSLPPAQTAVRVGPLPTFPSPLLRADMACPVVADVLQLAAPWWSGDSARHELPDEPWMTRLTVDIAGKPRKGRLDPVGLDVLAVRR